MKLEQQVISLELARKLKELGVKQESLFVWGIGGDKCENEWTLLLSDDESWSAKEIYSAFTVAELGEMLPEEFYSDKDRFSVLKLWYCNFEKWEFPADTEANARAKMLIYLLENKLLT